MNYAGNFRDIHLFAIGELRTDGWKSPWRLDLEKYLAEQALKPKTKRPAISVAPKPRAKRAYVPRPPKPERFCSICGAIIRFENKVGRCQKHYKPMRLLPCKVEGCANMIRKNNRLGACVEHWRKLHMIAKMGPRATCGHPGCLEQLTRKNRRGLCGWHGPWKNKREYKTTQPKMKLAA